MRAFGTAEACESPAFTLDRRYAQKILNIPWTCDLAGTSEAALKKYDGHTALNI